MDKSFTGLVKSVLSDDDEYRRLKLLEQDKFLHASLSHVPDMIKKIRAVLKNPDLNVEAQKRRALEILKEGITKFKQSAAGSLSKLVGELEEINALCRKAVEPEPWAVPGTILTEGLSIYDDIAKVLNKQKQALLSEQRAAEVRSYVGSLDKSARLEVVGKFGETANLLGLFAVATCPSGREYVAQDFLANARRQAIEVQGGGFLLTELEDARNMVANVAQRVTVVESILWSHGRNLGILNKTPSINVWQKLAQDSLNNSKTFL